ncbi:MAG: hypothetical protein QOI15_2210 [Pseudonocardiales bacterium]|nr:hypothetical protein [Pseudonocardiales bacterium]
MMRKLVAVVIGLALAVLLAACNIVTHVVVHADGSGTYSLILSAPIDATGDPGPAIVAELRKAAAQSDVPLTVTAYHASGESGAQASFTFRSLDDLKAESARLAAAGSGLNAVTVERTGAGWSFATATVPGGLPTPNIGTGSPGGPITTTPLTGLVHVSIVVELPGAPAANNATAVTHDSTTSTFSWAVAVGKPVSALQASTTFVGDQASVQLATEVTPLGRSASHDSSSAWLYVLIAVVAALILGAVVFVIRRRKQATAAHRVDEPVAFSPGESERDSLDRLEDVTE